MNFSFILPTTKYISNTLFIFHNYLSAIIAGSLHDGPQWLLSPDIHDPVQSPPTLNRVGLCNQQDTSETMACNFQGYVVKDITASALLFFTFLTTGEAHWHVMTFQHPEEGPLGEELKALAN